MTYTVTTDGQPATFPNEAAYNSALAWYDSMSKAELVDWYAAATGSNADLFVDGTHLIDGWEHVVMAKYAAIA